MAGSVTRANNPQELCYAPPIPIERKSCLVIPRLQHVRSLTPRAAAAVSRTDRRLTRYLRSVRSHIQHSVRTHVPSRQNQGSGLRACCVRLASLAAAKDVLPCYGSLRSRCRIRLGSWWTIIAPPHRCPPRRATLSNPSQPTLLTNGG